MPSQYRNMVYAEQPKFTEKVAAGFAASELKEAEVINYIDRVIRICERNYPEGLTYDGCRRVRPEEVYRLFNKRQQDNNKRWDFARTDVYLMEYNFSYKGQAIGPYYIFLPFVDDCGISHINGKKFYYKPVVKDGILQVTNNQIFLSFLSLPCTFNRRYYMVTKDDYWESISIYHGCFHSVLRKLQRKKNKISDSRIALNAHYLFIKYGFEGAFKRYLGVDVVVGTRAELKEQGVNRDDWHVYTTTGNKPFWVNKNDNYIPHEIRIAIKKIQWSKSAESMIASALFVFDLYPDELKSEHIKNKEWWALILGKIIFGDDNLPSSLIGKINEHIKTTDSCVDEISAVSFKENGIDIENIYDFLIYLIDNFDTIVHKNGGSPSSMVGRQLTIKRQALSLIIAKFVMSSFKPKSDRLTADSLHKWFVKYLKAKTIWSNNRGQAFCVPVMTPCDVRVFGVTAEVLPQDNLTSRKAKHNKSDLYKPRRKLDSSRVTIGSAFAQSKGEPDGLDKINPFVKIDEQGVLSHQDELLESAKRIDKILKSE